jgi:U4/U6.U5 tri-snRNP component SNU23
MADKKAGAYGAKPGGGDTDFRKTYDREEYAQKAKDREAREREEGKARYQAKLEGKKYHKRASTPEEVRMSTARDGRLDVASRIGTTQLVKGGATGRFSGLGWVCETCEGQPSFMNNIEYLEHCQSTRHLRSLGTSFAVERADLEMVRERLRWLSRKRKEAMKPEILDLDQRLDERRAEEEKEREEKRRKRNEKRRSKKQQDDW